MPNNLSDAVLGPHRRTPAALKRGAAKPVSGARAPTPPRPAPERRPEVKPEARPAKRAEPNTIRAIVVDPAKRTVEETRIATEPGDPRNGYGTQLRQDALADIIGGDEIEAFDMHSGEVVAADAMQDGREDFWRLGDDAPVGGMGIVVGYDADNDAYRDTALTVAEVRASVKWDAGADAEGDADPEELRAAISERLAELDAKQLQKLQSLIDEGALDEGEGDAASDDDEGEPTAGPRMAVRSPPKTKPTG